MKRKDSEQDMAKYFQDHKDDEAEWEDEAETVIHKPTSIVYSVRFSPKELVELRRAARTKGVFLSELIRTSVIQHVREADETRIDIGAPHVKFYGRAEPPTVGTKGTSTEGSPFPPRTTTLVGA